MLLQRIPCFVVVLVYSLTWTLLVPWLPGVSLPLCWCRQTSWRSSVLSGILWGLHDPYHEGSQLEDVRVDGPAYGPAQWGIQTVCQWLSSLWQTALGQHVTNSQACYRSVRGARTAADVDSGLANIKHRRSSPGKVCWRWSPGTPQWSGPRAQLSETVHLWSSL